MTYYTYLLNLLGMVLKCCSLENDQEYGLAYMCLNMLDSQLKLKVPPAGKKIKTNFPT